MEAVRRWKGTTPYLRKVQVMNLDERRANMVHGLRRLTDMLADVNTPLPYDVMLDVFWHIDEHGKLADKIRQSDARDAMRRNPGYWSKTMHGDFVTYTRKLTHTVSYCINVPRSDVCTRVKTGERQIPARTEIIYKWQCGQDA